LKCPNCGKELEYLHEGEGGKVYRCWKNEKVGANGCGRWFVYNGKKLRLIE